MKNVKNADGQPSTSKDAQEETLGQWGQRVLENAQLANRLDLENKALREELNHFVNSSIQFNLLREQLKFLEERPERKVFAEAIGESSDNLHHVLLINKGRNSGIRRNFPVVLRDGVVGRIQSVSPFSAVVQLIVDRRHRFPVLVRRSRKRMVMRGKGGGLELKHEDRGVVFGLHLALAQAPTT